MAIAKSLYQAPQGMPGPTTPDIEVEVENPDAMALHVGGVEVNLMPDKPEPSGEFFANLAEDMLESEMQSLASGLLEDFESDLNARRDWLQVYVDGIELLGMKIEERSEPWEGACGIYHPLLSEALVKFQAETMQSSFPAAGPVKTQIIGKETTGKKEAASRVQEDMNYQLMDVMTEYRPEHERMLWGLGMSGNAFKKVYYDPHLDRQVSLFVPAEDLVVPYGAANLEQAERVTHVMRKTQNELRRLQVAGFYRDIDLGEPNNVFDEVEKKIAEKQGFKASMDDRYKVLEMHVELDLPGYEHTDGKGELTGVALPYVVTIEKGSSNVLAIRRNWEEDDKQSKKRQHFVHYGYVPSFGFYCFGLIHLVGAFAKSGTSLIRQLVDAGTLSNLPGGFKARGMRVKGDDTPIAPGEWRDVDVPSGAIRDNLMPLPYKEPSIVLAQLLDKIVEEGRRFANAADLQISDMSGQAPVGTTLAILERTLKVMSSVQARVHYSMKQELKLLKGIIAEYAPEDYNYDPDTGDKRARKADYSLVDVIPVSDPNASTMAQKIVQYQAVIQLAQQSPQIYNMPVLHRGMLEVLGIHNADKLVPMEEDMKPVDPVTENQAVLTMKPVKAFLNQDHQAHIQVHMAAMQDPKILQLLKTNPAAQQIEAAALSHINEHIAFEYRKQIEKQLGFALPPQEDESGDTLHMSPEVEAKLSPLLAQAANQLLNKNNAEAAQQQAQQQAQDPMVQLQQQELQLKQQEQQRKAQKDMADAHFKQQHLDMEKTRIALQDAQSERKDKIQALTNAGQLQTERELGAKGLQVKALTDAAKLYHSKEKHITTLEHQGNQKEMDRQHQKEQAHVQQANPQTGE